MTGGERQPPRIRLRLTVLYASTLLVVLLGTAGGLRLAVRSALDQEFENSVRASALLVRQFFRVEIVEYQTTEATVEHIASELVFEERSIRIRRPDGTLYEPVSRPRTRLVTTLAAPVETVSLPLEEGLAPGWTIEVEASAANVRAVELQLDRWMMIGIPGLVLLAAAIGWWLTGRALRPVGEMADAATEIVPASGKRLPIDDPSDELGRLGLRFNALLDRLDGALHQQQQFLADAAHELRTPLARMRARVELAQLVPAGAAVDPSVESSSVIAELHDELLRMSRQVDELLQLARADAGDDATATSLVPLFLDDIATDEIRRWHPDAERAGITLVSTALVEAPVRAEPTLIGRLIGILIDNALRYGHRGGRVDVRVQREGDFALLEVEDDGIGIVESERERIFDRFYRGDRARVHRSDGSGLGLAIAAWIASRHGGSIAVGGVTGRSGTLITVRIPLHPPAQRPLHAKS